MVQYATAVELAGHLQQDLDTYSANQALTLASGQFSQAACIWFEPQTVTWTTVGTVAQSIKLPFRPVRSVSEVRVNGVAITGWALVKNTLWRPGGFGASCAIPPDQVDIDLVHGEDAPTDDVKAVVIETAASAYEIPVSAVTSESIDDYQVRFAAAGGGIQLTSAAQRLAEQYRGTFAA